MGGDGVKKSGEQEQGGNSSRGVREGRERETAKLQKAGANHRRGARCLVETENLVGRGFNRDITCMKENGLRVCVCEKLRLDTIL